MMKIGLFVPKLYFARDMCDGFRENLKGQLSEYVSDVEVESYGKCLCEFQGNLSAFDRVIAHPHYNEECFGKIKGIVEKNPGRSFFFLTLKNLREEMKKVMEEQGEHPNVGYLRDAYHNKHRDEGFIFDALGIPEEAGLSRE